MKKKTLYLLMVSILSLSLVFATGCSNSEEPAPPVTETPMPTEDETTEDKKPEDTKPEDTNQTASESDVKQAKDIADQLVKDIPEVEKARVFVMGDTAYAALTIPADASADAAKEIKAKAEEVIKKTDNKIKQAMISEDAAVMTRLEEYGKDIEEGKPIKGFGDEMKNLYDRVTPTT